MYYARHIQVDCIEVSLSLISSVSYLMSGCVHFSPSFVQCKEIVMLFVSNQGDRRGRLDGCVSE